MGVRGRVRPPTTPAKPGILGPCLTHLYTVRNHGPRRRWPAMGSPDENRRFDTRAVHSGEWRGKQPGESNGRGLFYPVSTPIYASTTFSHPDIQTTDRVLGGEEPGYSYARYDNPAVRAFEDAVGSLEGLSGDARAFAFGSGMAATHAALAATELTGGAQGLAAEQLHGAAAPLLAQASAAQA